MITANSHANIGKQSGIHTTLFNKINVHLPVPALTRITSSLISLWYAGTLARTMCFVI